MLHRVRVVCAELCLLLVAIGLAAGVLCGPALGQSELRDVSTSIVKDMVSDSDVATLKGEKLMVAEFENINGKGDAVPRIFQEMLTTAFIKDKHFKVIERAQLEKALAELKIGYSGLIDPENARKIGKMVGAGYMVVGSISDLGGKVSIDARIVSIESGESVTAAYAIIESRGSTGAVDAANPAPKIDLSQQSNNDSAGQMVGQPDNFGLLGGTEFRVAWRENLGVTPVEGFDAGDVTGDGFPRLALVRAEPPKNYPGWVEVAKWTSGQFKRAWRSSTISSSSLGYLTIVPIEKKPAAMLLNDWLTLAWDGTTYQGTRVDLKWPITSWLPGIPLRGIDSSGGLVEFDLGGSTGRQLIVNSRKLVFLESWTKFCCAADFDGDKKIEVAAAVDFDPTAGEPVKIYGLDGYRKAVTENGYDSRLAAWQPSGAKTPYLVACRNSFDGDKKPNGGHVFFIQWSGESYEEVWKSNKIDDAIIDMKVCDPKGEGKDGLVILSRDKKNSYLTKMVAD